MTSHAHRPQCLGNGEAPSELLKQETATTSYENEDNGRKEQVEPTDTVSMSTTTGASSSRTPQPKSNNKPKRTSGIPPPTPRESFIPTPSKSIPTPSKSTASTTPKSSSRSSRKQQPKPSSPKSPSRAPPVWERLYHQETALTASMKEAAQSGERENKIFSFSGGGSKKVTTDDHLGHLSTDVKKKSFYADTNKKECRSPEGVDRHRSGRVPRQQQQHHQPPPPSSPSQQQTQHHQQPPPPQSIRSEVRASSSRRQPTTSSSPKKEKKKATIPAHERLYQSETCASARIKGPRFTSSDNGRHGLDSTTSPSSPSPRKKKNPNAMSIDDCF